MEWNEERMQKFEAEREVLISRYRFHKLDNEKQDKVEEVRGNCRMMMDVIIGVLPECRERQVALTKLEEVMFWANAGISRE